MRPAYLGEKNLVSESLGISYMHFNYPVWTFENILPFNFYWHVIIMSMLSKLQKYIFESPLSYKSYFSRSKVI